MEKSGCVRVIEGRRSEELNDLVNYFLPKRVGSTF